MGKPPSADPQLEARVAQLEQRADITDQDMADLDARVVVLETASTTPPVTPPGGEIDNTLPEPEPPIVPIVPPEPPTTGGLSATYTVPSGPHAGTYVYSEAGGDGQVVTLLDPYVDPDGMFTMTCIAVTRHDAPMQVIFRQVPDWACVIFECCDALSTTNQHMMPNQGDSNTAIISDTGVVIETVELWGQWANGRWRWQSGQWPFPKDVAKLRASGLLPLFDGSVLGAPPPDPEHYEYIPMHLPPGAPHYVPQGGDPTLLSNVQGFWGAHPSIDNLGNMLRAAEGLCAYPWFIRDSGTWAVPNMWHGAHATKTTWQPAPAQSTMELVFTGTPGTYIGDSVVIDEMGQKWVFQWQPYATLDANGKLTNGMNSDQYPGATEPSGPFSLAPGPSGTPAPPGSVSAIGKTAKPFVQGSGLTIDEAHSGSMYAFPWIATGDPYWLEAIHAKYAMIFMGVARPVPRPKLSYGQIRETAWRLTGLMLSAFTTPEDAPSWLLPRSLWQELWEDEKRLWDAELVQGTSPGATVFHTLGVTAGGAQEGPQLAPWQEDMILQVVSWASMIDPTCKWMAEWKARDEISRTNGTSGWNQYMPSLYYLQLGPQNGVWYQTWAEAWSHNHVPPEPTVLTTSADYCGQLRAGMAFATQAGVTAVSAPLATLTANMVGQHYTDGWNWLFAVKG